MKKLATLLFAVAAVAFAGTAKADDAKKTDAAKSAAKTHMVDAEVVSVDATAKTLTIKGEPNKTVAVDASAVASLKDLKAGEKVKLTCRDNAKGEHEAVTHIAKAPAAK